MGAQPIRKPDPPNGYFREMAASLGSGSANFARVFLGKKSRLAL